VLGSNVSKNFSVFRFVLAESFWYSNDAESTRVMIGLWCSNHAESTRGLMRSGARIMPSLLEA
jgi:hypothetical protein